VQPKKLLLIKLDSIVWVDCQSSDGQLFEYLFEKCSRIFFFQKNLAKIFQFASELYYLVVHRNKRNVITTFGSKMPLCNNTQMHNFIAIVY
jgi:hypothetical protein